MKLLASSEIMQAEQIKALIESQIPDCDVKQVDIQGSHIGLVLVSPAFAGLMPVKKQQLVLSTLSAQFADGSIHAMDYIKAFTPEQWQQQQQQQ
jgi:acid stress-induced BolA-like protein IbaG/YrbA